MQWTVEQLSNDTYRIQNIDHSSYANTENGFWTKQGDSIVGRTHLQQWKIMSNFIELVVQRNVQPERLDDDDAPQLSNAIWELAKACWIKEPKERLTAVALCTILIYFKPLPLLDRHKILLRVSLETLSVAQPTPDAAHARPTTPPPNLIIRGHRDIVWCAMFSFDVKQIVSGSKIAPSEFGMYRRAIVSWARSKGTLMRSSVSLSLPTADELHRALWTEQPWYGMP